MRRKQQIFTLLLMWILLGHTLPIQAEPPEELRAFIIQGAVSLVALTGFAQGIFRFTRWSKIALAAFIGLWLLWLVVGFPQLWDGMKIHAPLIDVPFSWGATYALNRLTKIALFLFFFFLYA